MTGLQQIAVRTRDLADELMRAAHADVPNLSRVAKIAVRLRIAANQVLQVAGAPAEDVAHAS